MEPILHYLTQPDPLKANPDYDDQLTVFSRGRDALSAVHGYDNYVVGDVWSVIYPASQTLP